MKTFGIEMIEINGNEYVLMQSDVFHTFFNEMMKHTKVNIDIINEINKQYTEAKRIKRKRIRFKKEKQVLIRMYDILIEEFIDKNGKEIYEGVLC